MEKQFLVKITVITLFSVLLFSGHAVYAEDYSSELGERVYDDRGRIERIKRQRGQDIVFVYHYDEVTRTQLVEVKTTVQGQEQVLAKTKVDYLGRVLEEHVRSALIVTESQVSKLQDPLTLNASDVEQAGWLITTYNYDLATGRLENVKNSAGQFTYYEYDQYENVNKVTLPNGSYISYEYNNLGWLLSVEDADNLKTRFAYDRDGRLVKTTSPTGVATTTAYDENGNVVNVQSGTGDGVTMSYTDSGDVAFFKDRRGQITNLSYDVNSKVKIDLPANLGAPPISQSFQAASMTSQQQVGSGSGTETWSTKLGFDFQAIKHTPPGGRGVIESARDSEGFRAGTKRQARINETNKDLQSVPEYNSDDLLEKVLNEAQLETTFIRNAITNEVIETKDSAKSQSNYKILARDRMGRVVWYQQGPQEWVRRYDEIGRLVLSQQRHPKTLPKIEYFYKNNDASNRLDKVIRTQRDGKVVITEYLKYDNLNNVIEKKEDGKISSYVYGPTGLMLSQTMDGETTTYTYDPRTLDLVEVLSPYQHIQRAYDEFGRISALSITAIGVNGEQSEPIKQRFDYAYEALPGESVPTLKVTTTHIVNNQDDRSEIRHHDIHGAVAYMAYKDKDGNETKRVVPSHDLLGRMYKNEIYENGSSTPALTISPELYDNDSENLANGGFSVATTETQGAASVSRTAVKTSDGRTKINRVEGRPEIEYTYDSVSGNLTDAVFADGLAYHYDYHLDTNLVSRIEVTYPTLLNGGSRYAQIIYNDELRIGTVSFGGSGSPDELVRTYEYHEDKLTAINQDYAASNWAGTERFELLYDNMDRIWRMTRKTVSSGQPDLVLDDQVFAYDGNEHLLYDHYFDNSSEARGYVHRYIVDGFGNRTHLYSYPQSAVHVQTDALSWNGNVASIGGADEICYLHVQLNLNATIVPGAIKDYFTKAIISDGASEVVISLHSYADDDSNSLYLEAGSKIVGPISNGDVDWFIAPRPNGQLVSFLRSGEEEIYIEIDGPAAPASDVNLEFAVGPEDDLTYPSTPADVTLSQATHHRVTDSTNLAVLEAKFDALNRVNEQTLTAGGSSVSKTILYTSDQHIDKIVDKSDPNIVFVDYTYDALGRLINISKPAQDTAISYNAGSWQRRSTNVNGAITQFTWNQEELVRSQNPDGSVTQYASRGSSPLWEVKGDAAHTNGSGVSSVYAKGPRGDVVAKVGVYNSSGDVGIQERFMYDAEGNIIDHKKATFVGPLVDQDESELPAGHYYRGYWYEGGKVDLYHLQNRHYSSALGRFIQLDPARAGNNHYAYAGGDPVNRWDPSGLDWVWVSDGVSKAGGRWEWDGKFQGRPVVSYYHSGKQAQIFISDGKIVEFEKPTTRRAGINSIFSSLPKWKGSSIQSGVVSDLGRTRRILYDGTNAEGGSLSPHQNIQRRLRQIRADKKTVNSRDFKLNRIAGRLVASGKWDARDIFSRNAADLLGMSIPEAIGEHSHTEPDGEIFPDLNIITPLASKSLAEKARHSNDPAIIRMAEMEDVENQLSLIHGFSFAGNVEQAFQSTKQADIAFGPEVLKEAHYRWNVRVMDTIYDEVVGLGAELTRSRQQYEASVVGLESSVEVGYTINDQKYISYDIGSFVSAYGSAWQLDYIEGNIRGKFGLWEGLRVDDYKPQDVRSYNPGYYLDVLDFSSDIPTPKNLAEIVLNQYRIRR